MKISAALTPNLSSPLCCCIISQCSDAIFDRCLTLQRRFLIDRSKGRRQPRQPYRGRRCVDEAVSLPEGVLAEAHVVVLLVVTVPPSENLQRLFGSRRRHLHLAQSGWRASAATRLPLGLALPLASMASVRANFASGSREYGLKNTNLWRLLTLSTLKVMLLLK